MPHQCTDCGRQFEDGSKEMLSGCPECGGNKFQFLPAQSETADRTGEPEAGADRTGEPGTTPDRSVVGDAATAVRNFVGGPDPASDDEPATSVQSATPMAETEDDAQASARSEVISPDELPPSPQRDERREGTASARPADAPAAGTTDASAADASTAGTTDTSTAGTSTAGTADTSTAGAAESPDQPDLSELRAELNQQFESIKVLEPGQYELNLMELFDREEYIVALQEDGKYTVQVPEGWKQ